jgi:Toxin PAAR-like domain
MPYPNIAMLTQASGGTCSSKVKIMGKKTVVKGSEITMSSGDEAGTVGGVVQKGQQQSES